MNIVTHDKPGRKPNLDNSYDLSPDSIAKAAIGLLVQFPGGLIYPANAKTKVPLFAQYNRIRTTAVSLKTWLADFPRLVPAMIPMSFGLLGIDVDEGESAGLRAALLQNKVDFLAVASRSRGEHIYVRCTLAQSRVPGRWRAFGAGGDLRYGTNILLYRDAVIRLREFLGRRGTAISGALRDELIAGHAETSETAVGYDSVTLTHGRTVYMHELRNQPAPTWPGAMAQLEGMKAEKIKPNELRAIADAEKRRVAAEAWAETRLNGVRYRGRISETYVAMVALSTQGRCWASHRTIAEVAAIPDNKGKTVQRHQERLEKDGLIARTEEKGMSWRGRPTVVWDIVGFDGAK